MELNAEQIKKALECCIEGECDGCTYDEQTACKEYLLTDALALIKELIADNEQWRNDWERNQAQWDRAYEKLEVERDTFRDYAYKMQKYVENIKHKEEEGYEPSAARYAAEMEMWHIVALEKKRLEDENAEQDKAIINALERMGEIRRETKADTVRKMQNMVAVHFGTYTDKDTIKVIDLFKLLNQIAKEMLEGNDDND